MAKMKRAGSTKRSRKVKGKRKPGRTVKAAAKRVVVSAGRTARALAASALQSVADHITPGSTK